MKPAVYTIPFGLPFAETLALGILDEVANDSKALAQMTLLLPSRRACLSMRAAFLRASEGRPLLLPRLIPVTQADEDEQALLMPDLEPLPPPLSRLKRQFLLLQPVLSWQGEGASIDQAARLAADLGEFLDEVQREGATFSDLEKLVPAEHAHHWQHTLQFLNILLTHWPDIVAERGGMDPTEHWIKTLEGRIAYWKKKGEDAACGSADPVIAAGIDGGVPIVAALLRQIAAMPQGRVVLPGLDPMVDLYLWENIGPTHPFYSTRQLLDTMQMQPADVKLWNARPSFNPARVALLVEALRPAETAEVWAGDMSVSDDALKDFYRLDCPSIREEAGAIALIMRETLQTPGKTAALVTPDRVLARRVAAELSRFGIECDDSAGVPLALSPVGSFARLLLRAVVSNFAPHDLLALLRHPLVGLGYKPHELQHTIAYLDAELLRGPRPASTLAGFIALLKEQQRRQEASEKEADVADDLKNKYQKHFSLPLLAQSIEMLEKLAEATISLYSLLHARNADLALLARAHIDCAEKIAQSWDRTGAERLWAGDAGRALALFAAELFETLPELKCVKERPEAIYWYSTLFDTLLEGHVVRTVWGRHPRLHIWGLLEARLQSPDVIILGGLNEGTWPAEAAADPWLSRPMRKQFGLSSPDQRIGGMAHDFLQACGSAPVVYLTRSERIDGAPTIASRWLMRLDVVLQAAGRERLAAYSTNYLELYAQLDRPSTQENVQAKKPEPRPPLAARPTRLSVTQIETWMRDPYSIYARHILRLNALDPLDADPGAAEYGTYIHYILYQFFKEYPAALPDNAYEILLEKGRKFFGEGHCPPSLHLFWWPRFQRIAENFIEVEAEWRASVEKTICEIRGEIVLPDTNPPFTISAVADRIDILKKNRKLRFLDYKTGTVPTEKDVAAGFSPQLPLEAVIAYYGGFGLKHGGIDQLVYWKISGKDHPFLLGQKEDSKSVETLYQEAEAGVRELINTFNDVQTPYYAQPRPSYAPRYSDYEHLARVLAWSYSDTE